MRVLAALWLVLMLFLVLAGFIWVMGVGPALLILAVMVCVILTGAAVEVLGKRD